MTYIEQDHQASVTLNEVDESSILLRFSIHFWEKHGHDGVLLLLCMAIYLCLKSCKEQRSERNKFSLRLLLGWAGEHENSKHPSSL